MLRTMKSGIAAIVAALVPTIVLAENFAFCPADASGSWASGNFKLGTSCDGQQTNDLPGTDDKVFIMAGKTCNVTVDDAVASHIVLQNTATLNIQAGKKLTLHGQDATTSTIDDDLVLEGSESELAIATNNHTLNLGTASGRIVGNDNGAKITIAVDKILISTIPIEGKLEIAGNGTLDNRNTIHANTGGTIHINTKFVDDTASATVTRWKVSSSSSAVLRFNITDTMVPVLAGSFEIRGGGTLDLDNLGLFTTGDLLLTTGYIDVATGATAFFSTPP